MSPRSNRWQSQAQAAKLPLLLEVETQSFPRHIFAVCELSDLQSMPHGRSRYHEDFAPTL
jgi:hypothetical protein